MMKIFFSIFLFLLLIPTGFEECFAQQKSVIDSLLQVLKVAKDDTNKVKVLNDLCWEYRRNDPVKALVYGQQGLTLAKQLSDTKRTAISFNNIGAIYKNQGKYVKAIEFYLHALKIREISNDKLGIATSFNNIGIIYDLQGNYEKAIDYHHRALKIFKEFGDKQKTAASLTNIGAIYYFQKNHEKALNYFLKSLKIDKELGDKFGIAQSLGNIGAVYFYRGNLNHNPQDLKKAIEYHFKCLEIFEELGDKHGVAIRLNSISEVYLELNDYKKAIEYTERALAIAKEIDLKDDIKRSYQNFSNTYAAKNQFKKAYEYHQLYSTMKDTLFNKESSKQIAEMQTKYETEKKEKEIVLLNKDNELKATQLAKKEEEAKKQKIIILSIIGILLLSVAFAFVLYNRFRVIRMQKNIIEIQKKTVDEKNSDMNASIRYASRIQDAILTSDEFLNNALINHFILYKPKDVVSGDFYWAYQTKAIVIWTAVDCTGHGVPGAFMSMIGNSLLNEIVIDQRITTADNILNELRAAIIKTLGQTGQEGEARDGMDIALCVWDKAKNKLEFAGANNPLYLIRSTNKSSLKALREEQRGGDAANTNTSKKRIQNDNYELIETRGDKQPIGYEMGKEDPFTKHEIQLEQGDTIYIFSDGYQDQFGGPKGKKFRPKQFRELLLSIQDKPMDEQKKILDERIENWKGGGEQVDDILVIGVRV